MYVSLYVFASCSLGATQEMAAVLSPELLALGAYGEHDFVRIATEEEGGTVNAFHTVRTRMLLLNFIFIR